MPAQTRERNRKGLMTAAKEQEAPVTAIERQQDPGYFIHLEMNKIRVKNDWNPRTLFHDPELRELVEDIRMNGMIQPIVVRPDGAGGFFHLVAGERRYRAGSRLKLKTIPAIVRDLQDGEALQQTVSENLTRVALHPLEEAGGFDRMRRECAMSAQDIAKRTGKSVQYVQNRLHLVGLSPEVRKKALEMGDRLSVGYLQLIAQVGNAGAQRDLFQQIVKPQWGNELVNLKEAERLLEKYQRPIGAAQFKTTSPDLYPEAGACTTCIYNTTNLPREVFTKKEICTNVECFNQKQKLGFTQIAVAKGNNFIEMPAKEARKLFPHYSNSDRPDYGSGYVNIDDNHYEGNQQRSFAAWFKKAGGKFAP